MKINLCNLCPRHCNVNRAIETGFCKMGNKLKIAHVMLHHYEEPIISGETECDKGSGAIFFSGCSLKCEYCQNYKISHGLFGKTISIKGLIDIFKQIENAGAYNINLVTPTHFTDLIIKALKQYKPNIPIVWNCSGYETVETIEKLKGFVDVYLVDLKYFSNKTAELSSAPNYFEYASASILKMREQVPNDIIVNGIMQKGLIVRHLILPNCTSDSINILQWIKTNLGDKTIVSLMSQYMPCYKAKDNKLINRPITKLEYKRVENMAISLGLNNCYVQDLSSNNNCYVPPFGTKTDFKF